MTPDPYDEHLRKANKLFALGEVLKASQIWKAILKDNPTHQEARELLMGAKDQLRDLSEREAIGRITPQRQPEPPTWDTHSRSSLPDLPTGFPARRADGPQVHASSSRSSTARPSLDLPFSGAGSRSPKRSAGFPSRPTVSRPSSSKPKVSRGGLPAIRQFREALRWRTWRGSPNAWLFLGAGLLVLALGLRFVHGYLKDRKLEANLRAVRTATLATLALPQDLSVSREGMIEDAETALRTDPFRAYLIGERLSKGDPALGSELMDKARLALPLEISGASLAEFQTHLQRGNLDAAARVMDTLLRNRPQDGDLRTRAARTHLALSCAFAFQGKWDPAQEQLLRGRALFPEDKLWQARLRLLERVKELPRKEQALWIPLLG